MTIAELLRSNQYNYLIPIEFYHHFVVITFVVHRESHSIYILGRWNEFVSNRIYFYDNENDKRVRFKNEWRVT